MIASAFLHEACVYCTHAATRQAHTASALGTVSGLPKPSTSSLFDPPSLTVECPRCPNYKPFWMTESLSDVEIQQQIEISRYLVFAPFTILVYEYISTLRLEVERYWGTGLTWGTALFYINRYSALFGTAPILWEMLLTTTDPRKAAMCDAFKSYHEYFVPVSAMLIMRTYALYERNNYVLALMIFVTLSAVVFGMFILLSGGQQDMLDPNLQALGCPTPSPQDSNIRSAAGWGGMLVFDVMIFILTVYKALRYETRRGSLFSVMFLDGSIYFGTMIAVNAANIATYTSGGWLGNDLSKRVRAVIGLAFLGD
ncbi:hypothetical protein K438DRAFT_2017814 [Mycena galopus ATCC 62051]|nr:hypothetical protein K438DRAFT_2017814 [Mycena galopus ATCC 62051]